jgi:hypothetical protein
MFLICLKQQFFDAKVYDLPQVCNVKLYIIWMLGIKV